MTAKDYILSTLEEMASPILTEDIGDIPLEDAIFKKVMSKKFRKLRVDEKGIEITKRAIDNAIEKKEPITVGLLFGGNKLWRFEEAPEIDWAELFSLTYFVEWIRGIASVYKYGAKLEYYSQDISVESLNNIPRSETDKYSETFRSMLKFIKPYIPEGITITYKRHLEEYKDPDDYLKELEKAKKEVLAENKGKLPKLDEQMKASTELNVKLKPEQADDPQWREKVELQHQAIFKTPVLVKYLSDPMLIPACPTWYPETIATGSTKRSYAKFWAAVGVLRLENDRFVELVLTPNQLKSADFTWENVDIEGLEGKNFKKIRIIK